MRVAPAVFLVALFATGCGHDVRQLAAPSQWTRLKPGLQSVSPDVVEVHYIPIEREKGDPEINEAIWQAADEQFLPLDLKTRLKSNGVRVAKLGRQLPPDLLRALEHSNERHEGRRHHAKAGGVVKIPMTDVRDRWDLLAIVDGKAIGNELQLAQGYLRLQPTLGEGAFARIALAPEIEYGERRRQFSAAPDLSGLQVRNERDVRAFPELKLDCELESGEHLLVGCYLDEPGSLGPNLFLREDRGHNIQQALLIRIVRPSREELYTAGYDLDDFFLTPIREPTSLLRSSVREALAANGPARKSLVR